MDKLQLDSFPEATPEGKEEEEEAGATATDGANAAALISKGRLHRCKVAAGVVMFLVDLLLVLLLKLLFLVVVAAEGWGKFFEEKEGGRSSRDECRYGIFLRVPVFVTVGVEVEIPVAPAATEELAGRQDPKVGATVTGAAVSAATAAVLDEHPRFVPRPSLIIPPLHPPPPSSPAAASAVGTGAAVVVAVLPDDLVEGSPAEKEDGAESLALKGCCADVWNSELRDLSWVTYEQIKIKRVI